jgi:hypothetical protein
VRRTEEDLEAAEGYIDRWIDIDVNDAIAKAGHGWSSSPRRAWPLLP